MYSSRENSTNHDFVKSLCNTVVCRTLFATNKLNTILIFQTIFATASLLAQEEPGKNPGNLTATKSEQAVATDNSSGSAEPLNLLNGSDNPLKYWKFFSADQQIKQEETFYISTNGDPKEPVLICKGKPFGYLRYHEECANYDFSFEWKYAKDPHGNSGVILHVNGEDKIWPKGIQIQLHRPTAGSIFPSGGASSDNVLKVQEPPVKEAEWNACEINSVEGKISVSINGKKQGEVTGCSPPKGSIALQSEGAEIHFRKIKLRKLVVTPVTPKPTQPAIIQPVEEKSPDGMNTTSVQQSTLYRVSSCLQANRKEYILVQSINTADCQESDKRRELRHMAFTRNDRKDLN